MCGRVLKELPKSLDETYERMLKEIGKVNPHQAYRLLQCLTVATRPLRVEELAEVLALDFDGARMGYLRLTKIGDGTMKNKVSCLRAQA
jgi:hypothetical protein